MRTKKRIRNKIKLVNIIMVIIVIIGLLSVWGVTVKNGALKLESLVDESYSTISVYEKRRNDLLFNLVDSVKSYSKYEQETQLKVIKARNSAEKGNTDEVTTYVKAIAESYPELKADKTYLKLMDELASTENMIAKVRKTYNTNVRDYGYKVSKFPNSLFLNVYGYNEKEYKMLEYYDSVSSDAPQGLFSEK